MKAKVWVTLVVVLAAGCAGESDSEYQALKASENRRQASVAKTKRQDEQKKKEIGESAKVEVRPAIPELPEWGWEATREWNLPLNNPPIATAAESFLIDPEEYVVGVLVGQRARAYPWHVLANFHAINDKIGSKFVIVTHCDACNGGAAFFAKTPHATIDMRPCGIKNGTWYGVDFQTGSYWYPFIGEAFEGPLKGTKLKRIRTYFSTWREWVRDHPKTTVVLTNDEVRNRAHGRITHMAQHETFNKDLLARLSKSPPNPKADSMPLYELVFGLVPQGDSEAAAFRIDKLRNLESPLQIHIGDVPVVLFVRNEYQVGAYIRTADDTELTLKVISEKPFQMQDQLGNVWNEWGRRVSGPTYQSELPVADGYLTKWYEWLENFPETTIEQVGP